MWRVVSIGALCAAVLVVLGSEQLPLERQYFPDAPSYVGLAKSLTHGDYEIDVPGEPSGSRYPPGVPLLLAPFSGAAPASLAIGMAVALLAAVWIAAKRIAGHPAAAVAVLLMAGCAPFRSDASHVMADTPTAIMTVAAVVAAHESRDRLAGFLAGFATWMRVAQGVLLFGLRRRGIVAFLSMLAALAVTKLVWGWGYKNGQVGWSIGHILSTAHLASPQVERFPNVIAYPGMLLGLTGGVTVPGAMLLAGHAVWRRRERRLVLVAIVGTLIVYLPYFYQAARFLIPAAALIAIYGGVWVNDRLQSSSATGLVLREVTR